MMFIRIYQLQIYESITKLELERKTPFSNAEIYEPCILVKKPEIIVSLTKWVECLPMIQETGDQSQVELYQRLKKLYLMPPCLTLSIIR